MTIIVIILPALILIVSCTSAVIRLHSCIVLDYAAQYHPVNTEVLHHLLRRGLEECPRRWKSSDVPSLSVEGDLTSFARAN